MKSHGADSPNDKLVRRIRSLPRVAVQNSLMRVGDRQIALSMMFMEDADREFIFSVLPIAKVKRIREELKLQRRLKITYDQYKKSVAIVYQGVMRDRGNDTTRSYIRPAR